MKAKSYLTNWFEACYQRPLRVLLHDQFIENSSPIHHRFIAHSYYPSLYAPENTSWEVGVALERRSRRGTSRGQLVRMCAPFRVRLVKILDSVRWRAPMRWTSFLAVIGVTAMLSGCWHDNDNPRPSADRDKINAFLSGLGDIPVGEPGEVATGAPEPLPPFTRDDPTAPSGKVTYNCTTTPYSMSANPDKIATLNPDVGKLWLGSMLQGSGYAGGLGSLKAFPVGNRAPLKVYMDLLSPSVTRTVNNPDAASMQEAIGSLATDAENEGKAIPNVGAFQQTNASTTKQGLLSLGFSAKYLSAEASGELDVSHDERTSTVMAALVQRYFTVSFVTPPTPADYFSSDVKIGDFEEQQKLGRVGVGNPPVVVSSISYGRIFLMTISSQTTQDKLSAAVSAEFYAAGNGGSVDLTAEQKTILENSTFNVVSNGGDEASFLQAVRSHNIEAFLDHPSKLTTARPISYQVDNIAHGSAAAFTETAEYNLTTCTAQANRQETVGAIVKLTNLSVYPVRCNQNVYGTIMINGHPVIYIKDEDALEAREHNPEPLRIPPEGSLSATQVNWPDPSSTVQNVIQYDIDPSKFRNDGYYLVVDYRGFVGPSAAKFDISGNLNNAIYPFRDDTSNTYTATEIYPFTFGQKAIPGNSARCPLNLTYEIQHVRDLVVDVP